MNGSTDYHTKCSKSEREGQIWYHLYVESKIYVTCKRPMQYPSFRVKYMMSSPSLSWYLSKTLLFFLWYIRVE